MAIMTETLRTITGDSDEVFLGFETFLHNFIVNISYIDISRLSANAMIAELFFLNRMYVGG